MEKTATISDCGRFRYRLGRRWEEGAALLFVMLNPSTADAATDDPTIRRCVGFARSHGFNAIDVVNLFAFRATDPRDLRLANYPVGDQNDSHIAEAASEAGKVCVAWGARVGGLDRPQIVLPLLRIAHAELHCLAITGSGFPQHPLMARGTCQLQVFDIRAIERAMKSKRSLAT